MKYGAKIFVKKEIKKEMQNVFFIIVAQMQMFRDKECFCVWDTR